LKHLINQSEERILLIDQRMLQSICSIKWIVVTVTSFYGMLHSGDDSKWARDLGVCVVTCRPCHHSYGDTKTGKYWCVLTALLSFEMQSFPITTVHDCLFERFSNITLATNDSHLSKDNNYLADIFRAIHLKCRIKIKL